ncbi:MAG: TraR/DksA family transcriptional regulator, partial [Candidatus Kapaibacteriota bacterium]
ETKTDVEKEVKQTTEKKKKLPPEVAQAAKEIKSAIKKAPGKKKSKNPEIEAAKIPVQKPAVKKSTDALEADLKNSKEQEIENIEKNIDTTEETNGTQVVSTTEVKKSTKSRTSKTEQGKPVQQNTSNKKMPRYSDEDLKMFENVILEAKREALDELRMLKDRLEDLNSYDMAEESMIYSMHMGEQGTEPIEKEKTYAQIQRLNEYLKKLDEALERIKDKTYGICRVCGILIAKERLLAVPITTLSASWKIHQHCPEDGIDRIEPMKK